MINRALIRIKVLQILYSFYQNESKGYEAAENDLHFSVDKAYEMYIYLLKLIRELTLLQDQRLDAGRNKHLPTPQDLNPNTKLVENRMVKQLCESEAYLEASAQYKISWVNEDLFLKQLLDVILASTTYKKYTEDEEDGFEADKEFWVKTLRKTIGHYEPIEELFEEQSVFWNDDFETVLSFVVKTVKKIEEGVPESVCIYPKFRDQEDEAFATTLFRKAYLKGNDYRALIEKHATNWKLDRLAFMDLLIIQIAVAEIVNFPTIPVNVTINEYIELAKYYSTERSSVFVNGILDKIVLELREDKQILK